jgi:hypothetical protein
MKLAEAAKIFLNNIYTPDSAREKGEKWNKKRWGMWQVLLG